MKFFLLFTFHFLLPREIIAQDSIASEIKPLLPVSNETKLNTKKLKLVLATHIVAYGTATAGLYASWYKGHSFGNFHFSNDNKKWLQVDKAGHAWSGYIQGRVAIAMWRRAGLPEKKAIWLGGLTVFAYQNVVEVLDGFSGAWGFSWGDYIADIVGSSLVMGQERAWNEQRILYKFSTHRKSYHEKILHERANEIYGKTLPDRLLNDYNAQTYWLSINLKSFLKKSSVPSWLNLAIGYGAAGMFGELNNRWENTNGVEHDRSDKKRYRQFYISPDIDLTRIKTKSKFLKTSLFILNSFKFPAPSLEFSSNKTRFNWLTF